jgi:hypothetical protein
MHAARAEGGQATAEGGLPRVHAEDGLPRAHAEDGLLRAPAGTEEKSITGPAQDSLGLPAYIRHADAFNRGIRLLARDLAARYPQDPLVDRACRRTLTVMAVSPLSIVDAAGPYLYGYRAQVYALETDPAAAEAFFLANDYDAELRAGTRKRADLVRYIIPKAKESARGLGPEARRDYARLVVALLDNYVEYLVARMEAEPGFRPALA